MAKKKTDEPKVYKEHPSVDQRITDTLRENYMPYAMSVIVSRAIPEIDGFKPSHRKLLYTMYKMGLLNGNRTKSANIVGQTMKLNPHGDAAIYETMVRLTRGNEALLMPFVDSKGNFGKVYSRDMAFAAPRYTTLFPRCPRRTSRPAATSSTMRRKCVPSTAPDAARSRYAQNGRTTRRTT